MLKLITEDGRVLENRFFPLNCVIKTKCLLRSDSAFLGLRTEEELRSFMFFYRIDRRQYGALNSNFTVIGKIHIAVPKGQLGGSYCMCETERSVLVHRDEAKEYPEDRICKKCIKRAFPDKYKSRKTVLDEIKAQNTNRWGRR